MSEKNKLKVLMCSEASFLNSGFGTYTKELLSRLHKTNKYTIAEFASYGFVNDPRDSGINWIYYANAVKDSDNRYQEYTSRGDNQFGRWRFEKVLLDFKPDVVIDIRDYWMSAYQALSPLRKYFHWILMPTVDSEPQQEDWIDTFLSANAIFTYSDWGANVLAKQSSNKINYIDTTSPGVDLNTFRIKDKDSIKNLFGVPKDSIIIGSVMRNQKRKLIPELLISFRSLMDKFANDNPSLASKLFLYLHTSYPDMGWDIPELLKDTRLSNRVLFSYICKNCRHVFSSVYSGVQIVCPKCMNKSCTMPSVTDGFSADDLSNVYNLFDLYVQYSICEGFGMPQVEAGACGIPIATVNYSAMCDVVQKLNAFPINVRSTFKELETKAFRVYPDNDHLVDIISKYIQLPENIRNEKIIETRKLTEKYYNWDDTAKKWEKYLDYLSLNYRSNWNIPSSIMQNIPKSDQDIPKSQNFDMLAYVCQNYLKDSSLLGSSRFLNMLKDMDYGFTQEGPVKVSTFGYKNIQQYISQMIYNNNQTEEVRSKDIKFEEDFIMYAKLKGHTNE
jgi:glycosyltransferase involved in cell wall biosynthesis